MLRGGKCHKPWLQKLILDNCGDLVTFYCTISTDVRSCTKVFQHCIKKKQKHNVRNRLIFTIDASLLPLIHYVHISLWFTRTVVTEWNPYVHVTLQLYRELTVLPKLTGWTTFTQHKFRIHLKKKQTNPTPKKNNSYKTHCTSAHVPFTHPGRNENT